MGALMRILLCCLAFYVQIFREYFCWHTLAILDTCLVSSITSSRAHAVPVKVDYLHCG